MVPYHAKRDMPEEGIKKGAIVNRDHPAVKRDKQDRRQRGRLSARRAGTRTSDARFHLRRC